MKSMSTFDVLDINNLFKQQNIDYILKLKDACGSQSLTLVCTGKEIEIGELCDIINTFLKPKFIQIKPSSINPYNLIIF
ncbi:RDAC family protein [Tannockella kyphosi]|uniref:RDAC family protein n=1 Tax=Tannockella kyphosi TaxID=2899121 RepID=UPI0020110E95|nr:hypothetical protein [Tannockella kyphosi]